MAQQLCPNELTIFKELLITNMIEIQTISQLLFEKGICNKLIFNTIHNFLSLKTCRRLF